MVRILVIESAIVGVVATIIGLIGGLALFQYFITQWAQTMPEIAIPVVMSPATLVWAIGVGVVAVGLAPILTAPRKLRKMGLPSTVRVMDWGSHQSPASARVRSEALVSPATRLLRSDW